MLQPQAGLGQFVLIRL